METESPPFNPAWFDGVFVAILTVLITTEITLFSVVIEELESLAFVAFSVIAVVHLNMAAWSRNFNGRLNAFSEHAFLLVFVVVWLLWQSSEWNATLTTQVAAMIAREKHGLALCRCAFAFLIYASIMLNPQRPYFRIAASAAFLLLPTVQLAPISDNHAKQAIQIFMFMLHYSFDFLLSSLIDRSTQSSARSTIQAVWCLISASPLLLVGGTVLSLFVHIVDIALGRKLHIE